MIAWLAFPDPQGPGSPTGRRDPSQTLGMQRMQQSYNYFYDYRVGGVFRCGYLPKKGGDSENAQRAHPPWGPFGHSDSEKFWSHVLKVRASPSIITTYITMYAMTESEAFFVAGT